MPAHVPGEVLFERQLPPAGRERIALFSVATQDPNPIHVDDAFARRAGFPTVLQQGPMTTALFAQLLADTFGATALRSLDVTFTAPVFPDDALLLRAEVAETDPTLRCKLIASKQDGTVTASGAAEVSLSG